MRSLLSIIGFCSLIFSGCSPTPVPEFKTGIWRGVIDLHGQEMPFTFRVADDSAGGKDVYLRNNKEEILLDEITFKKNSVRIKLHVFDAELQASIDGDSLNGFFILHYLKNFRLPFKAVFGQDFRFRPTDTTITTSDFSGKYQVVFSNRKETIRAVGIFNQKGSHVTGTFLTPTGDYRFLEGGVFNDSLYLSTFDGNHSYLFKALKRNDSTLQGDFWSSDSTDHMVWTGIKNQNASLPDPESITYLKKGYDHLTFSFPDSKGNRVSLADDKFKNKVVVLQIFGTWCPNGMDVTKFLTSYYTTRKNPNIEILGLAYERKENFKYASARVAKMKEKWNVPYDIAIAGVNDKSKASKTLPELNAIKSFPTTIFIGKDGKVKHIYTGFEGPGTGVYHQQFEARFNQIINECLAE
jgi:thiol-disulfide isomerase/thioredoxin